MSTIVISGANRGIGLALAQHYARRGDNVFALCRTGSTDLDDCGARVLEGIDVAAAQSLVGLREALVQAGAQRIDVLINNAGILGNERFGALDDNAITSMTRQFLVNSVGPLLVTQALTPLLGEGSRVGVISSRMGSIADNTSGGSYGYRLSKAAANAGGASLAVDLRDRGVAVALLHPGYVRTDMTGGSGLIDAPESAAGIVKVLDELTVATSGRFWHSSGETLPW